MNSGGAGLHSIRLRLGRWLIRPEAARIYEHYRRASEDAAAMGEDARADRCEYMAMGASYVGKGWPHG